MTEGRGLFEVARDRMRTLHLALRTEKAYLHWIRRYVKFHGRRHPREMGAAEVEAFLTHLAVDQRVSAATQNQGLHALLFLYRQVLGVDLSWLENITRASKPKRLPVVLSRMEVRAVLAELDGVPWLVASLLYGGGLRLTEALRQGCQGSRDGASRGVGLAVSRAPCEAECAFRARAQEGCAGRFLAVNAIAQVSG
jgi:integrase